MILNILLTFYHLLFFSSLGLSRLSRTKEESKDLGFFFSLWEEEVYTQVCKSTLTVVEHVEEDIDVGIYLRFFHLHSMYPTN